jgi:hypothetical protein
MASSRAAAARGSMRRASTSGLSVRDFMLMSGPAFVCGSSRSARPLPSSTPSASRGALRATHHAAQKRADQHSTHGGGPGGPADLWTDA